MIQPVDVSSNYHPEVINEIYYLKKVNIIIAINLCVSLKIFKLKHTTPSLII